MRRLAAAAVTGLVLLTGCGSGTPRRTAQRGQSASTTATTAEPTTTTGDPTTTTSEPAPPATTTPQSRRADGAPTNGPSIAPGEPHPNPPGPPREGPPPQPPPPPGPPTPPCCKGPDPVRWESYTVSSDGRTLTFKYWSGVDACSKFDHASADESPSRVVVTIWERDVTNGNPCVAMAQEKFATVVLQAPLGNRTVVDGAA